MHGPEFDEIMGSLQEIVRRAYNLGRSDAVKQVVKVMQADESTWKPLALSAPAETAPSPIQHTLEHHPEALQPVEAREGIEAEATAAGPDNDNSDAVQAPPRNGSAPWWARPPQPAKSVPAKNAGPAGRVMTGLPRSR